MDCISIYLGIGIRGLHHLKNQVSKGHMCIMYLHVHANFYAMKASRYFLLYKGLSNNEGVLVN